MLALLVACGGDDVATTDGATGTGAGGTGVSSSASLTVGSGGSGPGTGWSTRAPLPSPRQECAVVALNGEIYVIGGFDAGAQIVADVDAYDPGSDTWRSVAPLPAPRHHANAASVNGKIYVLGSLSGLNFSASGEGHAFDPAADAWTSLAPMPMGTERGGSAVAVVGTKIYVAGGFRSGAVADVSAYDAANDTWETLAPLPEQRDHLVGGALGGAVLAVGGRNGTIASINGRVDAFDPQAGTWSPRAPMLTPRGGAAAAVVMGSLGEEFYVFGGEGNAADASGVFADAEAYFSLVWAATEPMLTPRHGTGAAGLDGVIYVPGGATTQAFGAVDTHEAYVPAPRLPGP